MPRFLTRRNLIAISALALFVIVLFMALRSPPITVQTAVLARGSFSVSVDEQGRTRARHRYTVSAPVTGRLLRTPLEAGDSVQQGSVLLKIAPPPQDARTTASTRAELEVARAQRQEAQARLDEAVGLNQRARREAVRRAELQRKGMVSIETSELFAQIAESTKASEDSARAALAAAEAAVVSANSRLLGIGLDASADALIDVRAPVAGRVLRVFEESERLVPSGTPLLELGDADALEIVIDLLSQDAVKVSPGDAVQISQWGGEGTLAARVRHVEPGGFTKISTLGVEEQRVNVIADFIDDPAPLGAEFRVEASIVTWTGNNVLMIPGGALFRRAGSWQVYVAEHGRAYSRQVTIGQRGRNYAELLSGVEEGASLILYPSDQVSDEARVQNED